MSYKAKPIYLMNPANSSPPLKSSIDSFNSEWLSYHTTADQLKLYHYTTLDGLIGILNNRSLWCSHIQTLNDPTELQYGKSIVKEQLSNHIANNDNENIKSLLEKLIVLINGFDILFKIFVGCFCESNKILSQWRNYSDKGGGYCIEFSFDDNTKFSHNNTSLDDESYIILRKIIYSRATQVLMINNCINKIIGGCENTIEWFSQRGGLPENWSAVAANEAINVLFDIMLSLKDPIFEEEKEWRIVKVIRDDDRPDLYNFRTAKERLIPYLDTHIYYKNSSNLEILPIKSITYGPLLEHKMTESTLKLFLVNSNSAPNIMQLDVESIAVESAGFNIRQ